MMQKLMPLMLFAAVAIALVLLLTACSSFQTTKSETIHTLENAGFTDIRAKDLNLGACGDSDKTGRNFVAMNPAGREVSGVVCCGKPNLFGGKNCTIRF